MQAVIDLLLGLTWRKPFLKQKTKLFKILRISVFLRSTVLKNRKTSATDKDKGSTSRSKKRRAERHNNILFINL